MGPLYTLAILGKNVADLIELRRRMVGLINYQIIYGGRYILVEGIHTIVDQVKNPG